MQTIMSAWGPLKHNLSHYTVWSTENQATFWPATFFSLQMDHVWVIFMFTHSGQALPFDHPGLRLCLAEDNSLPLNCPLCGWEHWFSSGCSHILWWDLRGEGLTESCSLTAGFIKVELLESPDFTVRKQNILLYYSGEGKPECGCSPQLCEAAQGPFLLLLTFILAAQTLFCSALETPML